MVNGGGRTDGRTEGRTSGNSPLCPTGHRPFGAAAQKGGKEGNKSSKDRTWSAVPLPCLFDVVKSQNVAEQRPRQGTKNSRALSFFKPDSLDKSAGP